jgi:DNA-binding IclR family transcriptional regulator
LELADELDVHRAIAYRIVATLEAHGLVMRGAKGMLRLGPGLLTLAARFEPQLRDVVQPVLERLANETGASAFLSVPQGGDCVAVLVAESPTAILRVAYRIGSRHPLTRGAAGIAILSGRPEHPSDPDDVRLARANGFSVTHGQLQQGAVGVACPLHGPSSGKSFTEASIGVVTLDDAHIGKLTEAVLGAARELRRNLGGASG